MLGPARVTTVENLKFRRKELPAKRTAGEGDGVKEARAENVEGRDWVSERESELETRRQAMVYLIVLIFLFPYHLKSTFLFLKSRIRIILNFNFYAVRLFQFIIKFNL